VLGIALSLRIVAFVLISPLFGAYAHLLPRRQVLVALDLLRAFTVLLLPFVDAVWQVYTLIFMINACSAGFTPLFQATIPDVLPDEALIYPGALALTARLRLAAAARTGARRCAALVPAIGRLVRRHPRTFLISAALVLSMVVIDMHHQHWPA
jgi:MFS family permease